MFDAIAQLGLVSLLVLPGFLIVRLSEAGRATGPERGDVDLVLRGLAYALVVQSAATLVGWLPALVDELRESEHWHASLDDLALYGAVVCVVVPTVLGAMLGAVLRRAETTGMLRMRHYALGGRDGRRAWDFMFTRLTAGAWVMVHLADAHDDECQVVLGQLSSGSYVASSPQAVELFLDRAWPLPDGVFGDRAEDALLSRGARRVWIPGHRIARIEVFELEQLVKLFGGGSGDDATVRR